MTPPGDFLVLNLAAKDFLRNICFHLSSGHLKLNFSYHYNGNWNFQMAITLTLLLRDPINWHDLDVLDLPEQLGGHNPLAEITPKGLSCTKPSCKKYFEKYMFSAELWTFEIALFVSFKWELKFSNDYNSLNIALGTWQRQPSGRDSPLRYFLALNLAAKGFLRNICFHLSSGHLKLNFSYHYNGNWNCQMAITCLILLLEPINWHDLDVLDLPEQLGGHNPLAEITPKGHSCTKPSWKRFFEKYMFSAELWTFEIALFISFKWEFKFSNDYNSLNIALGTWQRQPSGRDNPLRYFLVLNLAAKGFLRNICFHLSSGHLKLNFSYHYNGNWNCQMAITCLILLLEPINWHDLDVLDLPEQLGGHNPLAEITPKGLSSTKPSWKRFFEKYMFSAELWTFEIALFISLKWELKFSNDYNSLNIALGTWQRQPSGRDNPLRYFLVLNLAAKGFLRNICFHLSSGHLKLNFSYHYNGNWNFQMAITCLILLLEPINWHDLDVLDLPEQLGGHNPLAEIMSSRHLKLHFSYLSNGNWNFQMTITHLILLWELCRDNPLVEMMPPQVLSCTLPGCKRIFEKYVFSAE